MTPSRLAFASWCCGASASLGYGMWAQDRFDGLDGYVEYCRRHWITMSAWWGVGVFVVALVAHFVVVARALADERAFCARFEEERRRRKAAEHEAAAVLDEFLRELEETAHVAGTN